jgi:rhodanese-related sulfurtransferase
VATDLPSIIAASEVQTLNATNQVYIIDIRTATDFAAGHIANAHNVAVADVLTHIKGVNLTSYSKVAVVCYTGQTAGFVTALLRIMGYDKTFSLKWGMCSWNSFFASRWNTAIASGNTLSTAFTSTVTEKGSKGSLPVITTGKETGKEILEARVQALLTEGFTNASVSIATLAGNYAGYYIVNYWPSDQYASPGHINGAMQYTPKTSLKYDADLLTLPTGKPVAVYCYTGQTSAFLSAYLRLLGYDAKSVLYGTNGMIYDLMPGTMTKWNANQISGYTYVTGN